MKISIFFQFFCFVFVSLLYIPLYSLVSSLYSFSFCTEILSLRATSSFSALILLCLQISVF